MSYLVGLAVILGSVLILVECLAQLVWRLWPPVKATDEIKPVEAICVEVAEVVEVVKECQHDCLASCR